MRARAEAVRLLIAGEAFGQLLRFVVAGLGVTLFATGVYLALAMLLAVPPLLANTMSHLTGVAAGYAVHSRFSFRAEARSATMAVRFAIGSGAGFALNSLWVWCAVHALHGPAWLPVPAMVFVTPLASFALNRYWVFARD